MGLITLAVQNIGLNILVSKSLQDLIGLFNMQQILTHMQLLSASATPPYNMYAYNGITSQLVQKDMYPTDEIYGAIFEFTDSESPVEQFEDLGYEGANFLDLTGSLIINLILTSATAAY
jgi:hypothetical protein